MVPSRSMITIDRHMQVPSPECDFSNNKQTKNVEKTFGNPWMQFWGGKQSVVGRIYETGNFKLEVNESGRWKLNLKRSETTES